MTYAIPPDIAASTNSSYTHPIIRYNGPVAPEFITPVSAFGIARHKVRFAKRATIACTLRVLLPDIRAQHCAFNNSATFSCPLYGIFVTHTGKATKRPDKTVDTKSGQQAVQLYSICFKGDKFAKNTEGFRHDVATCFLHRWAVQLSTLDKLRASMNPASELRFPIHT